MPDGKRAYPKTLDETQAIVEDLIKSDLLFRKVRKKD
jgi:hypothetical protein